MGKLRRSDTRKKARRTHKTRKTAKRGGFPKISFSNPFSTKKVPQPNNGLVNITNAKNSSEYELFALVRAGQYHDVKTRLKQFGINPNVVVVSKEKGVTVLDTPLKIAIKQQEPDMVKLLLKYGANPNVPSKPGQRPIDILEKDKAKNLVFHNEMLEALIEALKAHGASD